MECIRGGGLPAGVTSQIPLEPYRIRMYDGNILFLMTDGVISALPEGQEEETMKHLIRNLPQGSRRRWQNGSWSRCGPMAKEQMT